MMTQAKRISYTLDTNADALILLKYPGQEFAPWKESASEDGVSNAVEDSIFETWSEGDLSRDGTDQSAEDFENEIIYRVSSRHLALSSGYFRNALSKGWPEGCLGESGLYQLSTEDWDPEAFLILMNILHLRNRQVPRELPLELLAQIAVLVDYYQCQEAVEMFSDVWVRNIKREIPMVYNRKLILCICVSWVFKWPTEFKKATEVAIKQCKTPDVRTLGLPIPAEVTSALEAMRSQAIGKIISGCHAWIQRFRDNHRCPNEGPFSLAEREMTCFSCGAILLGALVKELHRLQYLPPCAEAPFAGWSVESVYDNIKEMRSPKWGTGQLTGRQAKFGLCDDRRYLAHSCSLQTTVIPSIYALVSEIKGLSLPDFEHCANKT